MIRTPNTLEFVSPKGFLVIDGVNGAGKTSLQKQILDFLASQGRLALGTREPGDSELGAEIRKLVLQPKTAALTVEAELFLFSADRAEHVHKTIKPALKAGKIVISDRYHYSTSAFQGYGRGIDLKLIEQINNFAVAGLAPDFVILADLDPAEGLRRAEKRQQIASKCKSSSPSIANPDQDLFEQETLAFHTRMRQGFLEIAKISTEQFVIVDAARSQTEMFGQIKPAIESWLKHLK